MLLSVWFVLAYVVQTYGVTEIQILKRDIKIVDTKRLESLKKLEKPLQRSSPVILSLPLSHMVVESVMPVVLVMMGLVTAILAPTGQVVSRLSISVSILPIGHL